MAKPGFSNIEPWLYRMLFVSFVLPFKLQTLIIILYAVVIAFFAFREKVRLTRKTWLWVLLSGMGYWFYILYIPLTSAPDLSELFGFLERKISLLIFPLLIACHAQLSSRHFISEIRWFVFPLIIAILLIHMNMGYLVATGREVVQHHVSYRILFEHISGVHPTYFGLYCAFALVLIFLKGRNNVHSNKVLLTICSAILWVTLLFLSPKSVLLALLVIALWSIFLIYEGSLFKKFMLLALGSMVMIFCYLSIPFLHERVNEIYLSLFADSNFVKNNSVEVRSLIFKTDLALLRDHWLWGIGPVELRKKLNFSMAVYSMYAQRPLGVYNTHNEFLNQWICFGLPGFMSFVALWIMHILRAVQCKPIRILYAFTLILFGIACVTENILSRQQGVVFFALITNLLLFMPEWKPKIVGELEDNRQ
ncbi:MAG: O-antigen ligase family protein [Chitinophagaceae bacterium]|nr:O-antigen ligase family protein [Chitinophagaceae bacterium]